MSSALELSSYNKADHKEMHADEAANLVLPKLKPLIVQKNAQLLWRYPEGNFDVDNDGKLIHIESYHLLARLSKWNNNENVTKKVNATIEATFVEIYKLNQQGYVEKPTDKESFQRRFYVWDEVAPSEFHTGVELADKIIKSQQNSTTQIKESATLVKEQNALYQTPRRLLMASSIEDGVKIVTPNSFTAFCGW